MVTALKLQSPQPVAQEYVFLCNIAWETFASLVNDLESQPNKRLTYSEGDLEIWMPKPPHERYKKLLARLIEVLTEVSDVEICSLGSTTWNRKSLKKGVEADECYYIQNEPAIRGKMKIDLDVDPPPDLAIEVDMTSLSVPRLPIYAALEVPEIWRFDGSQLEFLHLQNGQYQQITKSLAIPIASLETISSFLVQSQEMGETSWAKMVRQWAQAQIVS